MWLVLVNKKRDADVDVFVYAAFTTSSIKLGLGKSTYELLTKRKGRTRDQNLCQLSLSKTPEPAGFGASLVLSTILLPRN